MPLNSFPSLKFACAKGTAKYPTLKCDEVYSSLMWQTYCFSLRPKLSHEAVGFTVCLESRNGSSLDLSHAFGAVLSRSELLDDATFVPDTPSGICGDSRDGRV